MGAVDHEEDGVRRISLGDLLLGCVMSSLLSIGACVFVIDYRVDQREAAFRASIPRIVTVDEKQLLKGFLASPENAAKTNEEFETAMQGWAVRFQSMTDQLAEQNNLILIRRSNVAAGAEDITNSIQRGLSVPQRVGGEPNG